MDMIEKVARVIAEKVGAVSSSTFCDITTTDDLRDAQLDICRVDLMAAARDVIEAMRDPQGVMVKRGGELSHFKGEPGLANLNAIAIFNVMVDAALKDVTPPTPQS